MMMIGSNRCINIARYIMNCHL